MVINKKSHVPLLLISLMLLSGCSVSISGGTNELWDIAKLEYDDHSSFDTPIRLGPPSEGNIIWADIKLTVVAEKGGGRYYRLYDTIHDEPLRELDGEYAKKLPSGEMIFNTRLTMDSPDQQPVLEMCVGDEKEFAKVPENCKEKIFTAPNLDVSITAPVFEVSISEEKARFARGDYGQEYVDVIVTNTGAVKAYFRIQPPPIDWTEGIVSYGVENINDRLELAPGESATVGINPIIRWSPGMTDGVEIKLTQPGTYVATGYIYSLPENNPETALYKKSFTLTTIVKE